MSVARKYPIQAEQVLTPGRLDAAALKEQLGLTTEEFASSVGRSTRSAARWLANEASAPATGPAAREIRRLAHLQFLLDEELGQPYAREWLRQPNRGFRGEAPIDLITSGRAEEVIGVLELLADGGPL